MTLVNDILFTSLCKLNIEKDPGGSGRYIQNFSTFALNLRPSLS